MYLLITVWIVVIILSILILYDGFKVRKVIKETLAGMKETLADMKKNNKLGLTFFDEPREVFLANEMKIIQAHPSECGDAVLAVLQTKDNSRSTQHVLYLNSEEMEFYDDQVLSFRCNLEFRQIGLFVYRSINNSILTVPVVDLFDSEED